MNEKLEDNTDDFQATPWQVLVGIRSMDGIAEAATLEIRPMVTPLGVDGSGRLDKTIPGVHFGDWIQRNQQSLVNIWAAEYAGYMNLLRAVSKPKETPRDFGLIDPSGMRLGTDREQ